MMSLRTGIICVFIVAVYTQNHTQAPEVQNWETKLLKEIRLKYRQIKFGRPIQDNNEPLKIKFSFLVTDINDLNEETEALSLNGIMILSWLDPSLGWKPEDYDGLEEIMVPDYYMWKPDVVLLNSLQMNDISVDVYQMFRISVQNSGLIRWYVLMTTATRCPLDITLFPFDEHKCDLLFGSWAYSSNEFKLLLDSNSDDKDTNGLDFSLLLQNQKSWSVIFNTGHVSRNVVHFSIILARRTPIFIFSTFLPAIVILVITMSIFWLPPIVLDKIVLGAIITKISLLLLLYLSWIVPKSDSSIPGIMVLCGTSICLASISVVVSTITVNISQRKDSPPVFIKNLKTFWVQKIFCLYCFQAKDSNPNLQVLYSPEQEEVEISQNSRQVITQEVNDWEFLAVFIDRCVFYLYCIIVIGVTTNAFMPVQDNNIK